MFNSTVLEVAVGLVFCYCSVSLIVSSLNEAIASVFKLRANTLLAGVKSLLNDPGFAGLARDIYNHALVDPQDAGRATSEKQLPNKPSYIPPQHFAAALIDVLQRLQQTSAEPEKAFAYVQDPQLRQLLTCIYARADGDLARFEAEIAAWFDNGMQRVAGVYKRQTQLISFVLALGIAAAFNIDSIHLFKALWEHPALAAAITANTDQSVSAALAGLNALPIGWDGWPPRFSLSTDALIRLVGWLITASSALFGAPFWFDALQSLVKIRGSGGKPDTTQKT